MSAVERVLSAAGLTRPVRQGGFCPACRGWEPGTEGDAHDLSRPFLTGLVFLLLAGLAWLLTIHEARSPGGMPMGGGRGSLPAFAAGWGVSMAAMMLPSALPLVCAFARLSEGRRGGQAATAVLAGTYLFIWLAFGVGGYVVLGALPVSAAHARWAGGVALALAGLYALTPLQNASEASCRELCALHGPLPFNLTRSALVAGARYGLSCVVCSGGLMVAMVIIGMAQLVWMVILAAMVLAYKLGPAPDVRRRRALATMLIGLAVVYALTAP